MKGETFDKQTYTYVMTMREAQTFFKYRSLMTDVKFNYKHNEKYSSELWRCDSCCTSIDTQSHVLWCPAYATMRQGKNLKDDMDLIEYITGVMKIRDNLKIIK